MPHPKWLGAVWGDKGVKTGQTVLSLYRKAVLWAVLTLVDLRQLCSPWEPKQEVYIGHSLWLQASEGRELW